MKVRNAGACLVLAAAVGSAGFATITPVSAQTVHSGKSYGCQINPNAKGCKKPSTAKTSPSGVVTGISTSAPATGALPTTGGAVLPSSGMGGLGAVLGSFLFLILGFSMRRFARRS